jgi:thiol-disulfide isomerase/thioredoxin
VATNKAQRERARNAREKIAAQRASARRTQALRRLLITGGAVAVVLAVVITLVAVRLTRPPAQAAPASADAAVVQELTSVSAGTFNSVGAGTATGLKPLTGQPELTLGGKPEVLYMGGEYCPFCAAERWALTAALSRFGTFSGLHFIHSSPADVYASTPTLTFYASSYTSRYVAFVPVEWYGEAADPSTPFGHVYLQHATAQQTALFSRYAGGSFPFVDVGNQYLVPQAQYLPSDLAGLSWAQVAAAMHDPSSRVGQDIDGAANMITAAICTMTHGQPSAVCTSAGVAAARGSI